MYINVRDFFSTLLYLQLVNIHSQLHCCQISRSWGFLCILGPFAFFVFLFCHPIWGRDSLKKRRIHEESAGRPETWFFFLWFGIHKLAHQLHQEGTQMEVQ